MTKKISVSIGTLAALIFLAASVFALIAYADDRGSTDRDRGGTGRTIQPSPSPTPVPSPTPTPPPPSGGITSVTDGSVNSGGNTGGNVTTGDEHVSVVEINIGPTNSPPPSQGEEDEIAQPPTPQPCQTDARGRTTCPSDTSGRTR